MSVQRTNFTRLNQRASIAVTWQTSESQFVRVFVKNQITGNFVIVNVSKAELLNVADAIIEEFGYE
jgi:ribose 1,5-bisphosphokinase PhnN